MRTAIFVAFVALVGCTSRPSGKPAWHPIEGASVTPWEQTKAICDPLIDQGRADAKARPGAAADVRATAQYRACMGQHGWSDTAVSAGRIKDRQADAEQLRAEIDRSRTKNALTMLVGESPQCQPGDPGTEICSWHWTRQLPTEHVPLRMTCVLPRDGKPRGDGSCRYGVDKQR